MTVIDHNHHAHHREDEDVVEGLHSVLKDEGIEFVFDANIKSISGTSGDSVQVNVEISGEARSVVGTHLLVAAGRVPNTKDIDARRRESNVRSISYREEISNNEPTCQDLHTNLMESLKVLIRRNVCRHSFVGESPLNCHSEVVKRIVFCF